MDPRRKSAGEAGNVPPSDTFQCRGSVGAPISQFQALYPCSSSRIQEEEEEEEGSESPSASPAPSGHSWS